MIEDELNKLRSDVSRLQGESKQQEELQIELVGLKQMKEELGFLILISNLLNRNTYTKERN